MNYLLWWVLVGRGLVIAEGKRHEGLAGGLVRLRIGHSHKRESTSVRCTLSVVQIVLASRIDAR